MSDDAWKALAQADVCHPAGLRTFPIWGAHGMALLRRLEALIRRRLEALGYVEIGLPTLCRLDALTALLGDKTRHVYPVDDGRNPALALAPFSDLQYVEHALAMGAQAQHVSRAFQWSHRFVREASGGVLDFGEYVKCEVFSLHRGARDAIIAGAAIARAYRALCVSDLALWPLLGKRPRRTAFPGTEETWAAEIPLPGGEVQTLIVSHRMKPSFFATNGFAAPDDARLNSSCFSQKLLGAVLFHHRDAHGFRLPPALAPTVGLLMAASADASAARAIDRHILALDRVVRLDGGDPVDEMVQRGAAWAIQPVPANPRRRVVWRLYARRLPLSAPRDFDDIGAALTAADRETLALERALRRDLRHRAQELRVAHTMADLAPSGAAAQLPAIAAPCCRSKTCSTVLLDTANWIPKLLTTEAVPKPCVVCGGSTRRLVLFETEERYTSFYLPTEESERPFSPRGDPFPSAASKRP